MAIGLGDEHGRALDGGGGGSHAACRIYEMAMPLSLN